MLDVIKRSKRCAARDDHCRADKRNQYAEPFDATKAFSEYPGCCHGGNDRIERNEQGGSPCRHPGQRSKETKVVEHDTGQTERGGHQQLRPRQSRQTAFRLPRKQEQQHHSHRKAQGCCRHGRQDLRDNVPGDEGASPEQRDEPELDVDDGQSSARPTGIGRYCGRDLYGFHLQHLTKVVHGLVRWIGTRYSNCYVNSWKNE